MKKQDVLRHFGTQERAAEAVGLTRQAVSAWPEVVPEGVAYKLQVITGGALRVQPDLYRPRSEQRT